MAYASHLESGETFLRLGRVKDGVAELRIAEKIAPELHDQVAQTLHKHGM
jgi:signal transduction histidine kinase